MSRSASDAAQDARDAVDFLETEMQRLLAEVERLRGVVGLCKFPESHFIWPDDHFAPNMWVAVPKPRFEALRAALAELEGKG